MNEIIVFNECSNTGKEIFLYENATVGSVEAFGYSAFLLAGMLKKPLTYYNESKMLPCVILRQEELDKVKSLCTVDEYDNRPDYMHLHVNEPSEYDSAGYDHWVDKVRAARKRMAQGYAAEVIEPSGTAADSTTPAPHREKSNKGKGSHSSETKAMLVVVGGIVVLLLLLLFVFG